MKGVGKLNQKFATKNREKKGRSLVSKIRRWEKKLNEEKYFLKKKMGQMQINWKTKCSMTIWCPLELGNLTIVGKKRDLGILDPMIFSGKIRKN